MTKIQNVDVILKKKTFAYLKDAVYQAVLPNGLRLYLLPKTDFSETYGILTADFGAIDTTFRLSGEKDFRTYPAGIAHFLEHKLFEQEDGGDAMAAFSKIGASANAYTGLYQTSYLFSTTEQVKEALQLLQEFVGNAHFTEESVEREKDIIKQEIEMYQDDPDYRLYTEILASLYPQTPLAQDIAGTVESISKISAQALNDNYQAFYGPENMSLFVIGNFEIEEIWQDLLEYNQAVKEKSNPRIERQAVSQSEILAHRKIHLDVATPKLAIGLAGRDQIDEDDLPSYRLALSFLFSMLFGWTSQHYQKLYEAGKIDSSFSLHLEVHSACHFMVMTLDTKEPIAVSNFVRKAIREFENSSDMTEEHLDLLKKEAYGDFIRSLNSLEATASQFVAQQTDTYSIFDLPSLLKKMTLQEVLDAGHRFIENCDMTDFTIFPK